MPLPSASTRETNHRQATGWGDGFQVGSSRLRWKQGREGEGRSHKRLIRWRMATLPLFSKVTVWQSLAVWYLVSFLPEKERSSLLGGEGWLPGCMAMLSHGLGVPLTHSPVDCSGHCGLTKVLFGKTSVQKELQLHTHNILLLVNKSHLFYFSLESHFPPFLQQWSQSRLSWFICTFMQMNFPSRAGNTLS